jgi:iron complex transport system substrate-binding protein
MPGKMFLQLIYTCLLVLGLVACGQGASEQGATTTAMKSPEYPVTVTDGVGRKVTLEERPERISSMAPSITETLFAVGAGDRVVGVTTADNYPPEVKEIEKIGDYKEPNIEKLLAVKTDLLLISFDSATRETAEDLEEKSKADVIVVNPDTVDEAIDSIGLVAEAVGNQKEGRQVQQQMRDDLAEIEEKVSGEPKPTVFYELYGDPLQTVGPGSFIHDAINLAGGTNIAAGTKEAYPTYSEETLFQKNPDYYLVSRYSNADVGAVSKRPGYDSLKAVKRGNVVEINDDLLNRPGPRIVEGVRQIAETIHPEVFE